MIGSIGFPEIVMIMLVVLMLFGPKKLPEIAKLLGNTIREFKRTINDAKATIQEEIDKADIGDDLKQIKNDLNGMTGIKNSIRNSLNKEINDLGLTTDINEIKDEIENSVEEKDAVK